MSRYAPWEKQKKMHDRRNPALLCAVCAAALLLGTFLERNALTVVGVPDRAMAPALPEGSHAAVCRVPLCNALERGASVLISTPAGPRLRKLEGLPGDTAAALAVPAAGLSCNPAQWNDREFDALFPLMLDQIPDSLRDSLTVVASWTDEGRTIDSRETKADRWLDRFEMRRQAEALASRRPGSEISWTREPRLKGKLLDEHVWTEDLYLFSPENGGWSQWLLPADSAKGRVLRLPRLP